MILFLQLSTLHHAGHIEYLPGQGDGDRVPRWRPFEGPKYFHGPAFAAAMAPYLASTEIVVTDWGVRWPEIAQGPALPSELRARFVDTLWLLDLDDYRSDLAGLFSSIQFWLKRRRPTYNGPWLCVDKSFHSWPEHEQHRLIVGGGLGNPQLRAHMEQQIRDAYGKVNSPAVLRR